MNPVSPFARSGVYARNIRPTVPQFGKKDCTGLETGEICSHFVGTGGLVTTLVSLLVVKDCEKVCDAGVLDNFLNTAAIGIGMTGAAAAGLTLCGIAAAILNKRK